MSETVNSKPFFENKIAIVLLKGLLSWQELNVTAFLASGIASHFPETMGSDYKDASQVTYLGTFRQPVMIYQATLDELKQVYKNARENNLHVAFILENSFKPKVIKTWK